VVQQVFPYTYELNLPVTIRIHRVQPLAILDPVAENPLVGQRVEPPPHVEVDGKEEYQVAGIENRWVY
jgi:hypothetical protein